MKTVMFVSEKLIEFGAAKGPFNSRDINNARKGKITLPLNEGYSIGDETFGRKSMLFIRCPDIETRYRLERFLHNAGVKIHEDYWPGSSIAEVQVSYFKGWHWDE